MSDVWYVAYGSNLGLRRVCWYLTGGRPAGGDGLASIDERGTTCCYARQDEFWVEGAPDAERWEVYTVLADSPTFRAEDGAAGCCSA